MRNENFIALVRIASALRNPELQIKGVLATRSSFCSLQSLDQSFAPK